MRILVSNDDGVFAPGLDVLSRAMMEIADVEVFAPDRNRSGASNSLSLLHPLRVKVLENGYHAIDGTPTDCVHLALTGYFDKPFDLVLSGVNDAANLGDDVIYSGTVAAAMEGCNLGLPSLAFSMVSEKHEVKHYETAVDVALKLVMQLKGTALPAQTLLNVNVPDLPLDQIKGIEITRLGTRHPSDKTVQLLDPRQRPIYWIGAPGCEADANPGTDFDAVRRGYVSITPMHLDMTHYQVFDQMAAVIEGVHLK